MNNKEHFIYTEKGYCYYSFDYDGCHAIIYGLYVEKVNRGTGYAKHLLNMVISEIRGLGYVKDIYIEAKPYENNKNVDYKHLIPKDKLVEFYTQLGLKVIDSTENASSKHNTTTDDASCLKCKYRIKYGKLWKIIFSKQNKIKELEMKLLKLEHPEVKIDPMSEIKRKNINILSGEQLNMFKKE